MGKKIAICVGQNDYDPRTGVTPLRGCVNDALLIGEMLKLAGFDIIRQIHNEAATQEGILSRLSAEVAKLRDGDHLVFWNSSHGYQVQDRNGDELVDGLDEAICSYDTDPRDPLIDDKFGNILSRIHPGAFVFFGSDSCHSATLSRAMQKMQSSNGSNNKAVPRLWTPPDDVFFRSGKPTLDIGNYAKGLKGKGISAPRKMSKSRRFGFRQTEKSDNYLLLSGCKADEQSWDTEFPQGNHGVMTYHFAMTVLEAWSAKKSISYQVAYRSAIARIAKAKYNFTQNPQLEGSASFKQRLVFDHKP